MTLYDFITEFTFPHECAFAPGHDGDMNFVIAEDVQGDDGGVTKYGIDTASHMGVPVAELTAYQAAQIYIVEYGAVEWSLPNSQPALSEFPGISGLAFFDAREVCGQHEAWLFAQRALGLTDDGVAGQFTRDAIMAAPVSTFVNGMISERRKFHIQLGTWHANDAQFVKGWLNRCNDLEKYLLG